VAAGGRLRGNARRRLNVNRRDSGMKKVVFAALIATLSFVLAAPSYASLGREAPAQAHIAKKCKKKHKRAAAAKKKCKKKKKVVPPTPAPTPTPLSDAEVIPLMVQRAAVYCAPDPDCVNSGYYYDSNPSQAACDSKSTYVWSCFGWNDEDTAGDPEPEFTCAFREIIERVGIDGITSRQDLGYADNGWNCFEFVP
jgi:hypothetical protein